MNIAYRLIRAYTLRDKLNQVNELNGEAGRILDVGCGTGEFLKTCQRQNWQVAGVEPDGDARALAITKLGCGVESDLGLVQKNQLFDVITLWHVLEHVPDLNQTIRQLRELLTNEGTLLIAVPNSDSYDAELFKQHWAAYDVPRHFHHFVPSTIEPLFRRHNFVLADKRPMKFDAYYISMLSTQYQTGKMNYLKSVQTGFISNKRADRTGNYSSLTYVFKKA